MWKRFAVLFIFMGVSFSLLYMRIYTIVSSGKYTDVAVAQGRYVLTADKTYGNIYDCNMNLLNNSTERFIAAVNPTTDGITAALRYAEDREEVKAKMTAGLPFLCAVSEKDIACNDIRVFVTASRFSDNQQAAHIIGYTRDGRGVSGLEYAYDYLLHSDEAMTKAVFEIDASGGVLEGFGIRSETYGEIDTGVITTLDSDIQQICETAAQKIEKGAIVVMTPEGELRAVVSIPDFDPTNLGASLESEDAPFINRAFSAYNVGSVFKLVTAAAAIEQGISPDTVYECEGDIDISGQLFRCHKLSGHGELTMGEAIKDSCNTYFIAVSEELDGQEFVDTAKALGFGERIYLANGMSSVSGNLQSYDDALISAEKANMSFGQGKLTATPVQIAAMTAAIANNGKLPSVRLVSGTVENGVRNDFIWENGVQAIDPVTSYKLRGFMELAVSDSEASNAKPFNTSAAGKTSTAQTGRYDDDGNEILQAWFTGYFPAEKPQYIVTVLVEDGQTGNFSAAPVFREIAEEITWLEKGNIAEKAQ